MPRITEMYAYIASDQDPDDEGVAAGLAPDGAWIPLVGADWDRIESLRPIAQALARHLNRNLLLVRFSVREEVEEISPQIDS